MHCGGLAIIGLSSKIMANKITKDSIPMKCRKALDKYGLFHFFIFGITGWVGSANSDVCTITAAPDLLPVQHTVNAKYFPIHK